MQQRHPLPGMSFSHKPLALLELCLQRFWLPVLLLQLLLLPVLLQQGVFEKAVFNAMGALGLGAICLTLTWGNLPHVPLCTYIFF